MYRINNLMGPKHISITALLSLFALSTLASVQAERDPHRPVCVDAHCRKVRSFLKTHYCGESPFGNGPDDGCEIKRVEKPETGVEVLADYKCEWSESKQAAQCEQHGQPSTAVRNILTDELHRIGLSPDASGQTYFEVWKAVHSSWSVAMAHYSRSVGPDLELCEVIVVVDENSHVTVLRKLPFQKTDLDVPTVTQWAPVDIADVDGDGHEDIVLEGDAYENHWLEVISVHDGSSKTEFSGLGYYL
jgi:hypothetical protein